MNSGIVYPKFRWFVALAISAAWLSLGIVGMSVCPLLSDMERELGQDIGTLAILMVALNTMACGVGTILGGPLLDKYGVRTVLLCSCILMALVTAAVPFASRTIGPFVAVRILQGFFGGPITGCLSAVAQRWFPPQEQGTFTGLPLSSMAIGFFLTFAGVPALVPAFHYDWRKLIASIAIFPVAAAVLLLISLMKKEPVTAIAGMPAQPTAAASNDFAIALKLPSFWFGAILMSIASIIVLVLNSLGPSYLSLPVPMGIGMSAILAGKAMSYPQIGWLVSGVSVGFILQKIFKGSVRSLIFFSAIVGGITAFSVVLPFVHDAIVILNAVLLVMGIFLNFVSPGVAVYIASNYPPHTLGKVFASTTGICTFAGAVGSAACGALLKATHSFMPIFVVCLALGIIGGLLGLTLKPITAFQKMERAAKGAAARH